MLKKILITIFVLFLLLSVGYAWLGLDLKQLNIFQQQKINTFPTLTVPKLVTEQLDKQDDSDLKNTNKEKAFETEQASTNVKNVFAKQSVPFIVQAPFGNWSDPVFQNGCEEASIVMAMGWLNGEHNISASAAQNKILDIVNFENKTLGYNTDTDAWDVQKIFAKHFNKHVEVVENPTLQDLIVQVETGKVVLVPAYGRALKNPNYTAPGPVTHMLTVIGYNPKNKKFITNDPGTKHGKDYVYDQDVLFDAIWKYPSGNDLPAPSNQPLPKAVVVVSKKS